MARARTIKIGFFTNDQLCELEPLTRLLFAGLWTLADRAGRVLDRPKKIRAEILPYDDFDVDLGLELLVDRGFIIRYCTDGLACIQIVNWSKHQNPHPREAASELPAPSADYQLELPPVEARQSNGPATAAPGFARARPGPLAIPSGPLAIPSGHAPEGASCARAPEAALDELFFQTLEDEFWEPIGSREAVRDRIAAALGHKARLNYTDVRAYLRNWLRGDAERAAARSPTRRNGHGPPADRTTRAEMARKFAHLGATP